MNQQVEAIQPNWPSWLLLMTTAWALNNAKICLTGRASAHPTVSQRSSCRLTFWSCSVRRLSQEAAAHRLFFGSFDWIHTRKWRWDGRETHASLISGAAGNILTSTRIRPLNIAMNMECVLEEKHWFLCFVPHRAWTLPLGPPDNESPQLLPFLSGPCYLTEMFILECVSTS